MMRLSALARALLQRATHRWVYARRLPVSSGGGRIYVTPGAGLKYLFKSMANADAALLRHAAELVRPGDVVWDIGSNVGLFAFAAAARAGKNGAIFAFEPDAVLARILRKSAAAQPASSAPVTVVTVAVASNISLRRFMVAPNARALNAIAGYGYAEPNAILEQHRVMTANLDWLTGELPQPDVIKCDVEGAEAEVFAGQTKMLSDIRPLIICEVGRNSTDQITQTLLNAQYCLYDGDRPLSSATEMQTAPWMTIAIPQERRRQYVAEI